MNLYQVLKMGKFGVGHFCNIPQTAWFLQKMALNLKAHYDQWLARY